MKTIISRVLGLLLFAGWAGCVSAQPITGADTDTHDAIGSANTGSVSEHVERPHVTAKTGQMAGRVFLDPATGKMGGPSGGAEPPGLSVSTQNRLNRSSTGLQARQLPDGTLLLDLQGRFQNMGVATLDKDGEAHLSCSHSIEQVEKAMTDGADPSVKHGESER